MKKIKLYEIQQVGNTYCGPSAISAIAGVTTKDAALLIRTDSPHRTMVKGSSARELVLALRRIGFSMEERGNMKGGTLRSWMRAHGKDHYTYIVLAGNHWIVLQDRNQAICGMTKVMVHIDDHPKAQARVAEVYQIFIDSYHTKNVEQVIEENKKSRHYISESSKAKARRARTKARRLIYQYHMVDDEMDPDFPDTGAIMIYPGNSIEDNEELDPYYGDHTVDGWENALKRVLEYIDILEKIKK